MTVYNLQHSQIIDSMWYYRQKWITKYKTDNLDCEIIYPSSNIDHHNYTYTIIFYTDDVFSIKSNVSRYFNNWIAHGKRPAFEYFLAYYFYE